MSNDIKVMFKRLHKKAKIPKYAYEGDSGCDLCVIEDFIIRPGDVYLTDLGFSIEIQETGIEAQIRSRSGLATKERLVVINQPGTLDNRYRGPVKVGLVNLSGKVISVKENDKIAQMVFVPVYRAYFVEVKRLNDSSRGTDGLGSTGTIWYH